VALSLGEGAHGAVSGPTYRSREAYRTRRSGGGADAVDPGTDFGATALDRPVADASDLRRAALMERVERARSEGDASDRQRRRLWVALLVVTLVAVALGGSLGAFLACR